MPSAAAIVQRIRLHLLVSGRPSPSVETDFVYDLADPYAVKLRLQTETIVEWTFARDLLHRGMFDSAGIGDVRVSPASQHAVNISLSSPSGSCVLEVPMTDLSSFLDRTFAAVPSSGESQFVNIDKELANLLGE